MLNLPILNVRLSACPEDWQQMTPTAQGRHCASCNREVVDFTAATQTDLDAARAAAPDGRLCGRFRLEQVAVVQPQLRPKLRRFLVALVLVCGLGMTSGEAWAQVRKAESAMKRPALEPQTTELGDVPYESIVMGTALEPVTDTLFVPAVYTYVEQMPVFPGGQESMQAFIQQHLQWPEESVTEGHVFVNFIVGSDGKLREFKLLKGVHPLLDAEALRVARLLDGQFSVGKQNGRAVDVYYAIRVTFQRK